MKYKQLTIEQAIEKNDGLVIACGLGSNSIAILAEFWKRGWKPDHILFADTGGEMPHTYQYKTIINNWLFSVGWPQVEVVTKKYRDGSRGTLYQDCINKETLPSKAYGHSGCSAKFKLSALDVFLNNDPFCKSIWGKFRKLTDINDKITRVIGFDAGEDKRQQRFVKLSATSEAVKRERCKYDVVFPLMDWKIDREGCIKIIHDMGWKQPGKSACYFCPAAKKAEVIELADTYPGLLKKALIMEKIAIDSGKLRTVQGLGRRFSWIDLLKQEAPEKYAKICPGF